MTRSLALTSIRTQVTAAALLLGSVLSVPALAANKAAMPSSAALERSYTALWIGAASRTRSYDKWSPTKGKPIATAFSGGKQFVLTRSGIVHANYVDAMATQNGVVSQSLGKNPVAPTPGSTKLDPQAALAYRAMIRTETPAMKHAPPRVDAMTKYTLPDTVYEHAGAYGLPVIMKNELFINYKTNEVYAKTVNTYMTNAVGWYKIGAPLEFAPSK